MGRTQTFWPTPSTFPVNPVPNHGILRIKGREKSVNANTCSSKQYMVNNDHLPPRGKAPGRFYRHGLSLIEFFERFPDEAAAEAWFVRERFRDGLYCPRCGIMDRVRPNRSPRCPLPFWCHDCKLHFSVRTGSVLAHSKIPLHKWLLAIYLHVSSRKGVSSLKLHRDLKVTYRTAWFMLHRLRAGYANFPKMRFAGPVEMDETYIGGKQKWRHDNKKYEVGGGPSGKLMVAAVKSRSSGNVRAEVLWDGSAPNLRRFVLSHVKKDCPKYSDQNSAYFPLENAYSVAHRRQWAKKIKVRGVVHHVHTNGLESFWSHLKRSLYGTYHHVSFKHLHRYIAEFEARHNMRHEDTIDQMEILFSRMLNVGLTYRELCADG